MECTIKRILQFNTALKFCEIEIIGGNNIHVEKQCKYSWSTDGVCFTGWMKWEDWEKYGRNIDSDFYLRILIWGVVEEVRVGGLKTDCYSMVIDNSDMFLVNFCQNENLYNPYIGMDCALELQQQLSDSIICMFGIPIYYIKVSPKKETKDYTFKEYVLHNVEDVKQLKLMVEDGQMPSSKPVFTEFDYNWETDWEVEMGKTMFATAFGDTAFPKQRDLIYIPMMKRLWEVNSAYDEKQDGLMWRSTTWKLSLVKYNDKTNVEDVENILDQFVSNTYNDVFFENERLEEERESGSSSLQTTTPQYIPNNTATYNLLRWDHIRESITKEGVKIVDKQLNHKSVIIGKNEYMFTKEEGEVIYQKKWCGEEGSLSVVLKTPEVWDEKERELLRVGEVRLISKGNTLIFNDITQTIEPSTYYMCFIIWDRKNFISQFSLYKQTHRMDIPIYVLQPFMYEFAFQDTSMETITSYNNDFNMKDGEIVLHGYPYTITNFRVFNLPLSKEDLIKDSCKYSCDKKYCLMNDVARPMTLPVQGYTVK